ncbi:Zn-dependent hydrolase [Stutzerimonas tarimensis]|uniref:Zn-dependent hydrolase n=1 Tax=Stutzerimonas tarimensis TaxID=1507735 RepID=A0ABV7T9K6_9GAMM
MSTSSPPECLPLTDEDLEAFKALFAASSAIGATPSGGLHRLAASREDGLARDQLCDWLREQDLEVRIDQAGNVFGLAVFDPEAPYVLCGSHLDSQPTAGRFDGAYGVIAGAVAVASLAAKLRAESIRPAFNIAVVNWTNEEGARFQPSLIGSSVFIGSMTAEQAWACRDLDGIDLKSALQDIGYLGAEPVRLPLAAYLEIHVEQGLDLERRKAAIGVVRKTWAALKLTLEFEGFQAHTGPTPMPERRDALLAASRAVALVRELADQHPGRMHSSVGRLEVYPNSPNVVPSQVRAFVEFRSEEPELLAETLSRFEAQLDRISQQTATAYRVIQRQLREAQFLHDGLARLAHQACAELGLAAADSTTIAGHDAISLSKSGPSMLLFVPSRDGIAHNEAEFTSEAQLLDGLRALNQLLYCASLGHGGLSAGGAASTSGALQ